MNIQLLNHALDLIAEIKTGIPEGGRLNAISHIIEKTIKELEVDKKNRFTPCGGCGSQPELIDAPEGNIQYQFLKCPTCGITSDTSNNISYIINSWDANCKYRILNGRVETMKLQKKVQKYEDFLEPFRKILEDDEEGDCE